MACRIPQDHSYEKKVSIHSALITVNTPKSKLPILQINTVNVFHYCINETDKDYETAFKVDGFLLHLKFNSIPPSILHSA